MSLPRAFLILSATAPLLAACAAAEQDLHGDWHLQSLQGKAPPVPVTLLLDADGRASGAAPCNRYFGAYDAGAEALEFGPIASTKRACPELAFEGAYFNALAQVTAYRLEAGLLTLSGPQDMTAVFTRRPPAAQDG